MERSSGRNYSQAAIAVLVIATSSALTEMWTILTHPFLFMYPQILKIIWKSFTPTAFSRNHRMNHRRNRTRLSWEMLKPPNSTGIQENLKDSPATTSTPWMSTTAHSCNWGTVIWAAAQSWGCLGKGRFKQWKNYIHRYAQGTTI